MRIRSASISTVGTSEEWAVEYGYCVLSVVLGTVLEIPS